MIVVGVDGGRAPFPSELAPHRLVDRGAPCIDALKTGGPGVQLRVPVVFVAPHGALALGDDLQRAWPNHALFPSDEVGDHLLGLAERGWRSWQQRRPLSNLAECFQLISLLALDPLRHGEAFRILHRRRRPSHARKAGGLWKSLEVIDDPVLTIE